MPDSNVTALFTQTREAIDARERIAAYKFGPTAEWLSDILKHAAKCANPDEPFFYLGGPMSNIPSFNFPAFDRAGAILRKAGYNIVNPAELDDDKWRAEKMASTTGTDTIVGNAACMQRDLVICSMPHCIGGIFLPGWHKSEGAKLETQVLDYYGKPLFEFHQGPNNPDDDGSVSLLAIERHERLAHLTRLEEDRAIEDAVHSIRESEQHTAEDEAWNSLETLGSMRPVVKSIFDPEGRWK